MPSSLVFVIVVGVWAAYAVQHWMRKREHLLTARNVDAFSEALRVLERRHEVSAPSATREQAATPLPRVAGPQLAKATPRFGGRSLRVGALAASVGLFVATALLAVLHVVSVAVPGMALVLVAGCVAWLRWSATQATGQRRTTTPAAGATLAPASQFVASASVPVAATVTKSAPVSASRAEVAEVPAAPAAREELFDIRAFDEPVPVKAAPVMGPGEWMPTPVPRPTYAMKASVATAPAPAPKVDEDAGLTPIDIDEEFLALAPIRNVG